MEHVNTRQYRNRYTIDWSKTSRALGHTDAQLKNFKTGFMVHNTKRQ